MVVSLVIVSESGGARLAVLLPAVWGKLLGWTLSLEQWSKLASQGWLSLPVTTGEGVVGSWPCR